MASVTLASNEGIIIQSTSVTSSYCRGYAELILTNLNIILIQRGSRDKIKNEKRFPISQIKKINGKPQVMFGKSIYNNDVEQLHITFMRGVEWFEFQSTRRSIRVEEIKKWIGAIYELLNCSAELPSEEIKVGVIESALKKGVDSVKRIFGIKSQPKSGDMASSEPLNIRCPGCKAPLTGKPGEVVQCPYCDTKHRF